MKPRTRKPLTVQIDRKGEVAVVRLAGSATYDQADRLTQELRQVAAEPFTRIVLELSGLDFICSMGLGALIVAHVVTGKREGRLVLAAPQPAIRELLETTRLDMILPIFADVAAAIQ